MHYFVDDFTGGSRDVGSLFMHSEVQNLLTKITGFDLDKIFSMRPTADYEKPKYKLMTAKQLQEVSSFLTFKSFSNTLTLVL